MIDFKIPILVVRFFEIYFLQGFQNLTGMH